MSAHGVINPRDVVKLPQYVVEGITPATYGVTPANPAFIPIGYNPTIIDNTATQNDSKVRAGNIDRLGTKATRRTNTIGLEWDLVPDDLELLKRGMNLPNGANTPDESMTMFDQYKDVSDVNVYRTFTGCKFNTITLNKPNAGFVTIASSLAYLDRKTDAVGPAIGTGSDATPVSTEPVSQQDSGAAWLTFDGGDIPVQSLSLTSAIASSMLNPSGAINDLWQRPGLRAITGNAVIFKDDEVLQNLAIAGTAKDATIKINNSGTAITLEVKGLLLEPSDTKKDGKTADSTMESKNFSADSVTVS